MREVLSPYALPMPCPILRYRMLLSPYTPHTTSPSTDMPPGATIERIVLTSGMVLPDHREDRAITTRAAPSQPRLCP
eukprot:3128716-Rhodomonas_salina.1